MSEASILRKEINKLKRYNKQTQEMHKRLKRCIREKNKIISNLQSEKESSDYYCKFQRTSEALKHFNLN
tara:strand:+ start:590 stop:796 length:207 start_codon:yes stop_codon:yes gene_type:complete